MGVPKNGWFLKDNPIKMDDDWGCPHFRKPPNMVDIVSQKNPAVSFQGCVPLSEPPSGSVGGENPEDAHGGERPQAHWYPQGADAGG